MFIEVTDSSGGKTLINLNQLVMIEDIDGLATIFMSSKHEFTPQETYSQLCKLIEVATGKA